MAKNHFSGVKKDFNGNFNGKMTKKIKWPKTTFPGVKKDFKVKMWKEEVFRLDIKLTRILAHDVMCMIWS